MLYKTTKHSPPSLMLALLNCHFTAAKAAKFHTCLALLLNHLKLWAVTKSECDFVMHFVNMTNHENIISQDLQKLLNKHRY